MPPRRAHTKSRKGCRQCKQRRVKCNETGPRCAQCVTRDLECSFMSVDASDRLANGLGPASAAATTSNGTLEQTAAATTTKSLREVNSAHAARSEDRSLELELMHMYTAATYTAFTHDANDDDTGGATAARDLWQWFVPREALKHDFLMQAVLAFAALHVAVVMDNAAEDEGVARRLWRGGSHRTAGASNGVDDKTSSSSSSSLLPSEPRSSTFYFHLALDHQIQACAASRPVLDELTRDNCDAVLAFSVVMTCLALAVVRRLASTDTDTRGCGPPLSPVESIFSAFDFLRGAASVSAAAHHWLRAGPFGESDLRLDRDVEEPWVLEPDVAAALEALRSLNSRQHAQCHADGPMDGDEGARFALTDAAVAHLEACFAKAGSAQDRHRPTTVLDDSLASSCTPEGLWGDERGAILAWPGRVGPAFVALLHRREPLALLVFLHWGVLLDRLRGFWWSRHAGALLVDEIAAILHARGKHWEERTRWARRKVRLLE